MKKLIASMVIVPMIALGASTVASAEAENEAEMETKEKPPEHTKVVRKMLSGLRDSGILLTAKGCEEAFGDGWVAYAAIGGRFPLAAGKGTDNRDETRTFDLRPEQREGGTYRHVLTEDQMPSHHHEYVTTTGQHDGRKVIDYGDDQRENHTYRTETTQPTGRDRPHNNMPPYLVLNFCHKP